MSTPQVSPSRSPAEAGRAGAVTRPALWLMVVMAAVHAVRGAPVDAAVFAGAVAAVLVDERLRAHRTGAAARPVRTWPWTAVALLVCLQELFSFLHQPDLQTGSDRYPTVTVLVDPLLQTPWARAVAAGTWIAVGCWLLRVARARR